MLNQIFLSCQKTLYHSPILTLLHLPYINSETRLKNFGKRKELPIFSEWNFLLIKKFQFSLITQYIIQYIFPYYFIPLDFGHMRMR